MNNEQTVQPEEILCAGQTEEGEMSEQSGSRTAGNLPCDSEGENRESSSEGEGEALKLREEAPRGDGEDRTDDPQVLAMPDPLGEDPRLRDEEDPGRGISQLREELKRLEERVAAKEAAYLRLEREYAEFQELYPGVAFASLSDKVWEDVKNGIPIAAAFALYERRRALTEEIAKKSNAENQKKAPGALSGSEENYFTPAEVRAMNRDQVRANYEKIISSMQKWN